MAAKISQDTTHSNSRRPFWVILVLLILALGGWSAYWYVAATSLKTELSDLKGKVQANDWVFDWDHVAIDGYPFQLRSTFTNAKTTRLDELLKCSVPTAILIAQPWNMNHILGSWTDTARCQMTPHGAFISVPEGRLSVVLQKNHDIPRISIETDSVTVGAHHDTTIISIENSSFYLRPVESDVSSRIGYDVAITLNTVSAPDLNQSGLGTLRQASGSFSYFNSPETWDSVKGSTVNLHSLALTDGTSTLDAQGRLDINDEGIANGKLSIGVTEFKTLINRIASSPDPAVAEFEGLLLLIQAFFHKTDEIGNETTTIEIEINDNNLSIAGLQLFQIPELH